MPPPSPDSAALIELAEKYRALAELRARRDQAAPVAPSRAALRALAARHPGCLRELDTLGPIELQRRAEAAQAAATGGAREPWMAWIWGYHSLMRATLATKRALGRRRPHDHELPALAGEAARVAGFALDGAFVQAVVAPPQRRLAVVVLRLLGDLFATPPATIAGALFPTRRPSPYDLEKA
jgi:hypothetical protein